jgi:hypothetical protein
VNINCSSIIPAGIEAMGILTKRAKNYLEIKPPKYSNDSLEETTKLETPNVMRKVLQSET